MRSRPPIVTAILAAVMLVAYLGFQHGQLTLGTSRSIEFRCNAVEYGLIPYEVTHPGEQLTDPFCQPQPGDEHERTDPGIVADAPTWLTPVTASFMHSGLLHLTASVLALVIFGPRLERRLGPVRFLGLFVAAGAASAAALIALDPSLPIATIGATGSVAGVISAHLTLWPRSRLTPFELPAPALAVAWGLIQLAAYDIDAAQPLAGAGGDIAYLAPAAGLIVGVLAVIALRPTARRSAAAQA
jgi:membrane associated rhomboid family serine protease